MKAELVEVIYTKWFGFGWFKVTYKGVTVSSAPNDGCGIISFSVFPLRLFTVTNISPDDTRRREMRRRFSLNDLREGELLAGSSSNRVSSFAERSCKGDSLLVRWILVFQLLQCQD